MVTQIATSIVKGSDSFTVGKQAATQAFEKLRRKKIDLVLLFISSSYRYEEVLRGVRTITNDALLIGCSSAGEFTEEGVFEKSVACALISSDTLKFFCGLGRGVKENQLQAVEDAAIGLPREINEYPHLSAMMFLDGLAGKGEETTLAALSTLGPLVRFAGGAASDDSNFTETVVFCNNTLASDAVSLCLIGSKKPVFIGVKHGHYPISSPLTITKAKNNVVYEIEGRPAFEVWKEQVEEKAKQQGIDVNELKTAHELGKALLCFATGLLTENDYKVRGPLSVNTKDGSLNFTGTMVEGSVIRFMESPSKHHQIQSARDAATAALSSAKGTPIAGAIIFDCVCRGIILEKDFKKGVEAVQEVLGNIPLIGFETYGEIAMELGQLSGFHNSTTVVLLLPE